jgi:hypothetical protein
MREILSDEQFNQQQQALYQAHTDKLLEIRKKGLTKLEQFQLMSFKDQTKYMANELANMTSIVARENRAMFELNKIAGIANVALSLPEKISDAWKWGNKWGGPAAGFAMAAIAAAAGVTHLQMIRKASFDAGGGGVAPSAAATPAPAVTPVGGGGTASGTGGGGGLDQTIYVQGLNEGELFTASRMRGLIEQLLEAQRNGARIVLTN